MNKEENRIVPQLRFPEFEEDGYWEETVVDDDFEVCSSKRVLQQDWIQGGVPFYRTRELVSLSKNEPFGSEIFISESLFQKLSKKYGVPKAGDFLVSGVGTLGILYQVKENDKFYFKDGNVIWFKTGHNISSDYFKYCFQTQFVQNQVFSQSSASTVGTYTISNARKTKFWKPTSKEEQQKIAACLSSLDEVITAETEKLDLLQDHKKGLLQQLFPAEGDVTLSGVEGQPKFRFPEFKDDGDWEETTLDEVADYENGKAHEQEISDTGKYKVVNSKFISTEGEVVKFTDSANLMANTGDILMVLSDIPNGKAIAKCFYVDEDDTYTVNQRICKITPIDIDNKFLFYVQNRNKYFLAFDDGVKQTNLRKETVLSFPFLKPKDPKEQQKIANCLSAADELLEAQAQKIEALQEHKKGLLQQLFPTMSAL
jgi:type I restriction enzyme S subunit